MKKILLFQAGTMQYGIALTRVMGVRSAKSCGLPKPEGGLRDINPMGGNQTPVYDLEAIFGGKPAGHRYQNEKVIMVTLQGQPAGFVVSSVKRVVSIPGNRIESLSTVFKGPSLSCFPEVLKHEGSLILMLNPEGLKKVADAAEVLA